MPHSGELGSQCAVSRKEQLRLRLLSAVSRNQAALASDQNERQRFLLTGESDKQESGCTAHATDACAIAQALEQLPWGWGDKSMHRGAET